MLSRLVGARTGGVSRYLGRDWSDRAAWLFHDLLLFSSFPFRFMFLGLLLVQVNWARFFPFIPIIFRCSVLFVPPNEMITPEIRDTCVWTDAAWPSPLHCISIFQFHSVGKINAEYRTLTLKIADYASVPKHVLFACTGNPDSGTPLGELSVSWRMQRTTNRMSLTLLTIILFTMISEVRDIIA